MGHFYTNFTLKCDDVDKVAEVLKKAKRNALLARDVKTGCVVVFDREAEEQDPKIIKKLGALLSRCLDCAVLAVANEDDDALRYWLFTHGKVIDSFDSSMESVSDQDLTIPGGPRISVVRFDPMNPARAGGDDWKPAPRRKNERGGDVGKLCAAFDAVHAARKILNILLKDYTFAVDQHRAICKALGLWTWAAGGGFEYISAGQMPKRLRKGQLIAVGAVVQPDV